MDTTSPSPDPFHGLNPESLMAAAAMPTDGGADTIPLTARDLPSLKEIAAAFPDLEILDLIGHGGMSAVFRARQPKLDRVVALKVLPKSLAATPGFAERFTREGRVLARLSHPNIVAVHDFGESGGFCYLIMEYVDGVNLRQAMRAGRFTPEQALNIIPAICDALQFAHTQGVLHRDIKPENILLDSRGRVKIADFGIAKIISEDAGDAMLLTQSGVKLGTAPYMAPEQIEKPSSVDHRADIYSLGVVFYEMLTGELPLGRFAAPSEFTTVGGNIDEIVFRALEKERGRRQQSAGEFKTQIEGLGTGQRPPQASKRPQNIEYKSKRRLWGLPLLHVALGRDPATGKRRHARGFFAFGDLATGVFAFGGVARGLFACGGIAVGGIAFGGMGLGLISFGGLAIALLLGIGGVAVGPLAMGGVAMGWYSVGGVAVGMSAYGGVAAGPQAMGGVVGAKQVVTKLAEMSPVIQRMVAAGPWLSALSLLWLPLSWMMMLVPWWARRQIEANRGGHGEGTSRFSLRVFWTIPALTAGCVLLWWLVWRWATIGTGGAQALIIPTVVSCLGLLFFGLSLPLWLRLVPMNSFYGVRLPSTFASDERWYDVNAVFGKQLFGWSLLVIGAGIAGFDQLPRHQEAYPWAAITLTMVAVATSVVATLWWMRQHPVDAPARKRNRLVSWSGQAVVAVVIAMFIKSFIAGAYRVPVGNEPGVAKDSHWLASHLDTGFEKGDLILFEHESGRNWIARVIEREPKGLRLKRGGSPDEFFVPWDKIVGKMLFSHFSPDGVRGSAAIVPAAAPKSAPIVDGTSKALEAKPQLRFLRLARNGEDWSDRLYMPEGFPINASPGREVVKRLVDASDNGGVVTQNTNDCWLQFWFSHPDFDRRSGLSVEVFDIDGRPLPDRDMSICGPGWSSNTPKNPEMQSLVISPGRRGHLPAAIQVMLHYSIGSWNEKKTLPSNFNGSMAFGHDCVLASHGDDHEKRAFVSWSKTTNDMLYDAVAQLKDGSWLGSSGRSLTGQAGGNIVERMSFTTPLSEVELFLIRSRKIQTVTFDKVVLPPLP